jgi:hypothetical protein
MCHSAREAVRGLKVVAIPPNMRLAAEAAEEDASTGKTKIAPYWRVVREDGSLNPKFPGGVERQAEKLRGEGHRILPGTGKRPPRIALPCKTAILKDWLSATE